MDTSSTPRPYSSPRRAQQAAQTRAAVVAAATRLFLERGWAGTTIAAVAAEAQVAVDTVYSGFSSKAGLLAAAKELAKTGDSEPVPLMDRPGFDALDVGLREARIAASAELIADYNERTRDMDRVWRQAAASDAHLAAELSEREAGRRDDLADGLLRVLGHAVDDGTLDSVWVISSPEVWAKLHGERHWTIEQYKTWLSSLLSLLLPTHDRAGRDD